MARETGSFWSTIPGFFTALSAFIGSIAALITALHGAGIPWFSSRPVTPAQPRSAPPAATTATAPAPGPEQGNGANSSAAAGAPTGGRSERAASDTEGHSEQPVAFNARYEGFATEGATRNALQAEFTRQGDVVSGTYQYPNGQQGQIQGSVNGNQLNYEWRWGGYSGRGLATERAGTIQGTWGYGDSAINAGMMVLQRAQP